jgi:predicted  nucleic acid-binding Zn-ribbon protein
MAETELESLKRDVAALNKTVAELRARIDSVGQALMNESTNNTQHFKAIYRYIADIHDYLMPILHKVFPNYKAAKKQIDAFMEQYGAPKNSKKIG